MLVQNKAVAKCKGTYDAITPDIMMSALQLKPFILQGQRFVQKNSKKTLVMVKSYLNLCIIARELSKEKAPQAVKDITANQRARNLSFSLL